MSNIFPSDLLSRSHDITIHVHTSRRISVRMLNLGQIDSTTKFTSTACRILLVHPLCLATMSIIEFRRRLCTSLFPKSFRPKLCIPFDLYMRNLRIKISESAPLSFDAASSNACVIAKTFDWFLLGGVSFRLEESATLLVPHLAASVLL
jgi:hypothetical protein